MLQRVNPGGPDPASAGRMPRQGWAPALPGKAGSRGEMQRRIEELSLLAEFNDAIGTLLDPDQVCATACSWLEEVVRWEVLAVSCAERESQQYRYQVLYLDDHL